MHSLAINIFSLLESVFFVKSFDYVFFMSLHCIQNVLYVKLTQIMIFI